jgi:D-psicose/D-tagatose/L-ribulose 3-epimerase
VPFKYSLVCDTLAFLGYDAFENPKEVFGAIKEAGYDGVDLPGDLGRVNTADLKAILAQYDLKVPAILGAWAYFHAGENRDLCGADESAREAGIRYARRGVDMAVEFGAPYFSVCAAQPPVYQIPFPELPTATMWQNLKTATREICAYAADRGVMILYEPLNKYEAYPGIMTLLSDATRMIEELGVDNLAIQPDISHMHYGEASIPDALRAAGARIKHMHINETNRYALGTGAADYRSIIRVLREIDFDGHMGVYMPLTTQDVFWLSRRGYGDAGGAASVNTSARPPAAPHLEWPIRYLSALAAAVDAERQVYGV